jgi:predicted RNA binding protein YcfA (HicA-like mRNA interferase family)
MSRFPATKAKRVLAALLRLGWEIKRQSGSHRTLCRPGWPDVTFAFHDEVEIGPAQAAGGGEGGKVGLIQVFGMKRFGGARHENQEEFGIR